MSLEGRVAVIAGATGPLGRVVAKHLSERGMRLALLGTHAGRVQHLVAGLKLAQDRWLTHTFNAAEAGTAREAAAAVVERFGRADLLLNLIGGWSGGRPVVDLDAKDVHQMLQQHLWTTFSLAQAFVPALVKNRWGRIVVVSSPLASMPAANSAPYAIGKAAQEALVLALAQELKGSGVTANILLVRTIDIKHERDRQRTARNASWTTPEEIAAAIVYLCSDQAGVINGARIPLYGSG